MELRFICCAPFGFLIAWNYSNQNPAEKRLRTKPAPRAVPAKVRALLRPEPRQNNTLERNDESKKNHFALKLTDIPRMSPRWTGRNYEIVTAAAFPS
jgi:hypothetical protein